MDVEVTVEAAKRPRRLWPYRIIETAGLVMLLYGLASNAWLIAITGVVVIVLTYAVYRHHHPASKGRSGNDWDGSSGAGDCDGCISDGGGGD